MDTTRQPFVVKRYRSIDSTNRLAIELGSQGADHGTVVLAEEQTGGRGRLSRQFFSPRGGLYLSVILRPDLPTEKLPLVTLAAGTSSAKVMEDIIDTRVALKWPNDLYCRGMKIGGILVEAGPYSPSVGRVPFVVVGIGININSSDKSLPESLHGVATSLFSITGIEYNLDQIVDTLVPTLLSETALLEADPDSVLADWKNYDYLMDKKIQWHNTRGEIITGIGKGLMPDGRYRLTTLGGDDYPVLAGDITITEINGQGVK